MKIKDRLSKGFIAGLTAGTVMDIIDHLSYFIMNESTFRSVDWVAVLAYGHKVDNLSELVSTQIIHLFFSAFLGMIFIYATPNFPDKNYLLKGWIWAILVWFLSVVFMVTFRTPGIMVLKLEILAYHFILASIFGFVLAVVVHWFNNTLLGGEQE